MITTIQTFLPYGILASHVALVILFLALIFKNSWGRGIAGFVGRYSIPLGFLVALSAICGSLFYSELVGFEPCVLCWWQRLFIYPQALLFATALWKKKTDVFTYAVPLVTLSAIIAMYHEYVYMGGTSLLPCTALGGACSKIYVMAFGYITIPMMSLTISLAILLLAWAHRTYEKNRNSR
ncbi:MAG: disulfide bond formation protein B [Minisyncoccia bacterium]